MKSLQRIVAAPACSVGGLPARALDQYTGAVHRRRLAPTAVAATGRVLLRRLFRGPRLPGWPKRLEILVEVVRRGGDAATQWPPEELRAMVESLGPPPPDPKGVRVDEVEVGPLGALRVREGSRDAALLWLHGGAYVLGQPDVYKHMLAVVARRAHVEAYGVRYRLAPEHPHPAAVDDAERAWDDLRRRFPPERIVIGGDSAGGGICFNLLQRLRERGELPAGAMLVSPFVCFEASGPTMKSNAGTDFISSASILRMGPHYLSADRHRDDVVPLHADPTGFPPVLIQAGGAEILLDAIERFARRCQWAGVDVQLQVYARLPHVPPLFAPLLKGSPSPTLAMAEWTALRLGTADP